MPRLTPIQLQTRSAGRFFHLQYLQSLAVAFCFLALQPNVPWAQADETGLPVRSSSELKLLESEMMTFAGRAGAECPMARGEVDLDKLILGVSRASSLKVFLARTVKLLDAAAKERNLFIVVESSRLFQRALVGTNGEIESVTDPSASLAAIRDQIHRAHLSSKARSALLELFDDDRAWAAGGTDVLQLTRVGSVSGILFAELIRPGTELLAREAVELLQSSLSLATFFEPQALIREYRDGIKENAFARSLNVIVASRRGTYEQRLSVIYPDALSRQAVGSRITTDLTQASNRGTVRQYRMANTIDGQPTSRIVEFVFDCAEGWRISVI
ncbi:hypothetical protein K2Z84_18790 [Candidatus Binatia bacterium]|nr:hypothetical protein [Candidatus Binatia bacterium]